MNQITSGHDCVISVLAQNLSNLLPYRSAQVSLHRHSLQYYHSLLEKGKQFSAEALIQYYQAMIARPDRTAILKSFLPPVLFIMGKQDKAVPFQHSLSQSQLPVLSHINILRLSAHMGMLEEKEKSLAFLADFLHTVYVY